MTDDGDVVCGKLQQTPKKSNTESQTLEFEDVSLTLLGCKRYPNNRLKCNFSVKAKQDGYLHFGFGKFFDTIGEVHSCWSSRIGAGGNGATCDGVYASTESLKNIPLRAELTFDKIPKEVKDIAALQLRVTSNSNNDGNKAIFRNIPISE
jgi:hypothetical protein